MRQKRLIGQSSVNYNYNYKPAATRRIEMRATEPPATRSLWLSEVS